MSSSLILCFRAGSTLTKLDWTPEESQIETIFRNINNTCFFISRFNSLGLFKIPLNNNFSDVYFLDDSVIISASVNAQL